MSRLVLSGDLNKNFGEYFPTPYIERVTLRTFNDAVLGDTRGAFIMDIEGSLLFTVPEYDPVVPTNDINFVKDIVNKLKFYYIVTKSTSDGSAIFDKLKEHKVDFGLPYEELGSYRDQTTGLPGPKQQHEEQLEKYAAATGVDFSGAEDTVDELSLLLYDNSILVELLKDPPATSYQNIGAHTTGYDPINPNKGVSYDIIHINPEAILKSLDKGNYTTFYAKSGHKVLKVMFREKHQTVIKVPKQVPLTEEQRTAFRFGWMGWEDIQDQIQYQYEESYDANVNLLAFTSILSPEQLSETNIKTNAALGMLFGDVAYEKILVDGAMTKAQIEHSYFDGNNDIYGQTPLRAFNGRYYKSESINHKSIVSEFKKLFDRYRGLMNKKTSATFKAVVPGSSKPMNDSDSNDPLLDASLESMEFALAKFAASPHLLPHLRSARQTILDRSSGTTTGTFYYETGELLSRINNIVLGGTVLRKKLTINAKVTDERTFRDAATPLPNPVPLTGEELLKTFVLGREIVWTNETSRRAQVADFIQGNTFGGTHIGPGEPDDLSDRASYGDEAGNIRYNFEIDDNGHLVVYMDTMLGRKVVKLTDDQYAGLFQTNYFAKEEYSVSFGYFLYDWQQHIVNNSFISKIVDVRSFQEHFGNDLLQKYFVPKKAVLKKYMPITINAPTDFTRIDDARNPILTYTRNLSNTPGWNPTTIYNPSETTCTVDRIKLAGPSTHGRDVSLAEFPEKVLDKKGHMLQHYLTERNFGFCSDVAKASNSNGKLMAFEFQNLDQEATLGAYRNPVGDRYDYEIEVQDGTKTAFVELVKHYYWMGQALREYLLEATEECSYNNIDGVFNDFFAEAMEAKFASNPGSAPWLMTAVAYIKHVDFMTNRYGGDQTQMLLATRDLIQNISPRSGTLDKIRSFYYNYIDFYETHYSEASTIGKVLTDPEYATVDGDVTGNSSYASPFVQTLTLSNTFTQVSYANQSESDRDEFISVINAEQTRYDNASALMEQELASAKGAVAADIKKLFEERKAVYEDKIDYEASRINLKGGCQYVWWWDAWNEYADFSAWGRSSGGEYKDSYGEKDQFSDIKDTSGIASDRYGYVWIDPHHQDEIVGWYDVEKYGEPSYFASYRRDSEGSYCRFQRRAYRYRVEDHRPDKGGHDKGERRYGGFAGSPVGGGKVYKQDYWLEDIKAWLMTWTADGSYDPGEQHIPGFDIIQGFHSYESWLDHTEHTGDPWNYSGAPSSGDYMGPAQQFEHALDQANSGFDQSGESGQTSNITRNHVGKQLKGENPPPAPPAGKPPPPPGEKSPPSPPPGGQPPPPPDE